MKLYRRAVLCLLAMMLVCVFALPAQATADVQALFINVGKADAILIWLEDQRYLVDTGTKHSFDQLEQALTLYGVSRLDGVIITHTDKDHVGGLKKLLKSDIEVDRVYAGSLYSDPSLEDHPVYKATEKNQMEISWLRAGDSIKAGNSTFWVLGPLTRDEENENNNSLVMELETPEGNMLLTGDMELEEEAELLNNGLIPQAAVLKVGHHGSNNATSKQLVLTVRPQWAVVSTSTEERPSTPNSKVLSRLWEIKAGVAVTQDAQIGVMITLNGGTATAELIDLK